MAQHNLRVRPARAPIDEEKARAAFVHGEEHSRATLSRPLTQDELDHVIGRYGRHDLER